MRLDKYRLFIRHAAAKAEALQSRKFSYAQRLSRSIAKKSERIAR